MGDGQQGPKVAKKDRRIIYAAIIVVGLAVAVGGAWLLLTWPAIEVPKVTLLDREEAEDVVLKAGLELGQVSEVPTSSVAYGLVLEQSPVAGTMVAGGSAVDIAVAVEPVPASVPDLSGLDVAEAERLLGISGFVIRVVDVFDEKAAAGTVLGQVPAAGAQWETGRPVAVAVSVGPDDGTGVSVPDVVGLSAEEALATLEQAGLGGDGFIVDPTSEQSVVVVQLPEAGLVVRPGAKVVLLVGER